MNSAQSFSPSPLVDIYRRLESQNPKGCVELGHRRNQSYIGSEQNFRRIQDLERRNLVVPLVGNFAGEKALRSIGRYVRDHNGWVAAFYLSNVEQYLFQQGDAWRKFYGNVETLPTVASSTLIRSVFSGNGIGRWQGGSDSISLLCPIEDLVEAFATGRILRYYDAITILK